MDWPSVPRPLALTLTDRIYIHDMYSCFYGLGQPAVTAGLPTSFLLLTEPMSRMLARAFGPNGLPPVWEARM
jgi:hypothetical protein